MKYFINKKNVKQSIATISKYLKEKNISIPYNVILETFSKALFVKNWNTLEAIMERPEKIKEIQDQYQYIVEIKIDLKKDQLLQYIESAFKEANSEMIIDSFYIFDDNGKDNQKSKHYQIIFNLNNGNNFLTALILLCEKLKKTKKPESMEFCRVKVEKESLMNYFNNIDNQEWIKSQEKFREEAKKYKKS